MISGATDLPLVWGATPDERQRPYPADSLVPAPVLMTRAISVAAPVEVVWRWLCQIAVAPYSYDWIDNRGRRFPRELTPGADHLELGQTMAVVFRLGLGRGRSPLDRPSPTRVASGCSGRSP